MHPKHIRIDDFHYTLPDHRIAHYPATERDQSKLLLYQRGRITENNYRNLADFLPPASLLLFNDSRVVEARLLFQKPTGGIIEIFCLEPDEQYADISTAMMQTGKVVWKCLIGGASKWKKGQSLQLDAGGPQKNKIVLTAAYLEKKPGCFLVGFSWQPVSLSFAEVLHHVGNIPLPPYIRRKAESADAERYQTIYARHDGSVAAPTAGLHFTDAVFEQLRQKKINPAFITLHVGAGTFQPVKTDTMETHDMHTEYIEADSALLGTILSQLEGGIVAVGTTSLRAVESLYWMGVKILQSPPPGEAGLQVNQWDPYELNADGISAKAALEALQDRLRATRTDKLIAKTGLLIAPGYTFRIAHALVTNFHQPRSTLLLLVAAFIGDDWKKVYEYALRHDFRFLSYGDGCLLFRPA